MYACIFYLHVFVHLDPELVFKPRTELRVLHDPDGTLAHVLVKPLREGDLFAHGAKQAVAVPHDPVHVLWRSQRRHGPRAFLRRSLGRVKNKFRRSQGGRTP